MKISFMGLNPNIKNKESNKQNDYSGYRLMKSPAYDSMEISFKGKYKAMEKLPDFITSLLNDLKKASTNGEVYQIIKSASEKDESFRQINPALFEYKGYRLQSSLQQFSNQLASKIDFANRLKIDSAPRLITHLKMGDSESIVLTYLPGCNEKSPISYRDFVGELSEGAKKTFMNDMKKLASKGLLHTYGAKGTAMWAVNPTNGHIMLDGWDSLQRVSKDTANEGLNNIKENLNRKIS